MRLVNNCKIATYDKKIGDNALNYGFFVVNIATDARNRASTG